MSAPVERPATGKPERSPEDIKTAMLGLHFTRAEAGGRALSYLGSQIEHLNDILSAAGIIMRHAAAALEEHEDCSDSAGALRATLQTLFSWQEQAAGCVLSMQDGRWAHLPIQAGDEFLAAMRARIASGAPMAAGVELPA